MSTRPLLLGEAPSEKGDRFHAFPLSGNPAVRICKIMGWETGGAAYWTLIEHFDTLNAIERFADAYPWSRQRAQRRWGEYLLDRYKAPDFRDVPPEKLVVVCLGRKAEGAVHDGAEAPVGVWRQRGNLEFVVAPHTSGRSRLWNDPETKHVLESILREALTRARATERV